MVVVLGQPQQPTVAKRLCAQEQDADWQARGSDLMLVRLLEDA